MIVDEALLDVFRCKRKCELCEAAGPVEPHHLFSRGMGGTLRVDVRQNLVAVCRRCHDHIHNGTYPRWYVLQRVADRERVLPALLVEAIQQLRWGYPNVGTSGAADRPSQADAPDQRPDLRGPQDGPAPGRRPDRLEADEEGFTRF